VTFIRTAQAAGLKLRQIGEILAIREQGEPPCQHVRALVHDRLAEVDDRIVDLDRIRNELLTIVSRLEMLEPADCDQYCRAIR
jgi:DNA-binding transcriptional MerR regulator